MPKVSITCAYCGATRDVWPSQASQTYCSRECAETARTRPEEDRFWENVDKNGPLILATRCWVWTAGMSEGYGAFTIPKPTPEQPKAWGVILAHRWIWEHLHGPIPKRDAEGRRVELDHLCHHRPCCNPEHLEVVTKRENFLRGKALITHCPFGHPYDAENTSIGAKGERRCRACNRNRQRLLRKAVKTGEKVSSYEMTTGNADAVP